MFSVETTPRFDDELLVVLDFIAIDSPNRALQFYDDLIEKLNNIPIYIHQEKKKVFILGIFNQNLWE